LRQFDGLPSGDCRILSFMKNLPLLQQHDLRRALHNEVHSRPPEALPDHTAVFCTVMWADAAERAASRQWLHQLLRDLQLPVPDAEANHLRLDLGNGRLRWELHTEFVSWTWMVPIRPEALDEAELPSASDLVPAQWLAGLPGRCLLAMNAWVLPASPALEKKVEQRWLYEDKLVASRASEQKAQIYTDFSIHSDGASRLFVLNQGLSAARNGRLVQRLLEIETAWPPCWACLRRGRPWKSSPAPSPSWPSCHRPSAAPVPPASRNCSTSSRAWPPRSRASTPPTTRASQPAAPTLRWCSSGWAISRKHAWAATRPSAISWTGA